MKITDMDPKVIAFLVKCTKTLLFKFPNMPHRSVSILIHNWGYLRKELRWITPETNFLVLDLFNFAMKYPGSVDILYVTMTAKGFVFMNDLL